MRRTLARISLAVFAGGFLLVGASMQASNAQTFTVGPNGIQVGPNSTPDSERGDRQDYRRHEDGEHGQHYATPDQRYGDNGDYNHHDDRWREVRHRMRDYRDECQDGDRGACVRLGIMIGKNEGHRQEWRREHPSYFWWDRD